MIVSEANGVIPALSGARGGGGPWLLRACRRRKGLVLTPALLCGLFAYLVLALSAPRYVADVMVAVESRKIQVVNLDSVVSRLSQENAVIRTELDIIGSYNIAARVADRLLLEAPAEAWGAAGGRSGGPLHRLAEAARDVLARADPSATHLGKLALSWLPAEWLNRDPPKPVSREEFIEWLRSNLRVTNDGRSLTILISFRSTTPEIAARVANAFADAYLDEQVQAKRDATREAADWLAARLSELRGTVEASEQALFAFQRSAGLFETKGTTLKAQQVSELNTQLVIARARRIGTEGRLRAARLLRERGNPAETLSDVLQSATIQRLRADEADARMKVAAARESGGARDPRLMALESNVETLRRQILAETDRIIASLASEVDIALQMERDLEAAVRDMAAQYGETSQGFVRLNQLQREAEANRSLYESFLTRYKQTVEQQDLAQPDARLVSPALPPREQSGPLTVPVVVLAVLFGLSFGIAALVLVERLDKRPRSVGDLEAACGVPVFGLIPVAGLRRRLGRRRAACDPDAASAEALERAFSTLALRRRGQPTRAVLVSSALPGEGRTSFCVALARSLARSGRKVLVVDADLRAPGVARAFGVPFTATIQDVFDGTATLEEAVRRDPHSGARFIAAAPGGAERRLLLSSSRFAATISAATEVFDIVLIDTPPVMATTDAAITASVVDARLLFVRWGRTTVPTVGNALRALALCGVTIDGIIAGGVATEQVQEAADAWRDAVPTIPVAIPSRV